MTAAAPRRPPDPRSRPVTDVVLRGLARTVRWPAALAAVVAIDHLAHTHDTRAQAARALIAITITAAGGLALLCHHHDRKART